MSDERINMIFILHFHCKDIEHNVSHVCAGKPFIHRALSL